MEGKEITIKGLKELIEGAKEDFFLTVDLSALNERKGDEIAAKQ